MLACLPVHYVHPLYRCRSRVPGKQEQTGVQRGSRGGPEGVQRGSKGGSNLKGQGDGGVDHHAELPFLQQIERLVPAKQG
eukprot:415218-Prorocentrum_minimum.AAC.1